jgi:hypothetical protein
MSRLGFTLWLEFEIWQDGVEDPEHDFFNMKVTLDDGREYALNVWTYKVLTSVITDSEASGEGLGGKYLLPPDLFVERLDRGLLEAVVVDLITTGAMKEEWRVLPDADGSFETE